MTTQYSRTSILSRHREAIKDLCESWEVDFHLFASWLMFRSSQPGCARCGLDPNTGLPIIKFYPNRLLSRLVTPAEQQKWFEHFRVDSENPDSAHECRESPGGNWLWIHSSGQGSQEKEWKALHLAKSLFGNVAFDAITVGFSAVSASLWRELSYESPLDLVGDAKYEVGQVRQAFFSSMIELGPGFFEALSQKNPKMLAEAVALRPRDVAGVEKRLILGYKASQSGLSYIPETR